MGEALHQQLDRLMSLFLDGQAANRAHREEMQSRLDALSMGGSGQAESQGPNNRHQGQSSGSGSNGFVPRYAKLDFPKFSGSEDPLGWLSRCEHFFRHQSTAEEDRVGLASYHLEGNAQLWFLQLLDDQPDLTWESFKTQCNLRFGPPIRSNKLGELAKLKQSGNVSDYQTQFELLVSRAGALSQAQKVQLYISGLKDYIAVEVELHHPEDLVTAMSLSRLYEKKSSFSRQPFAPQTRPSPQPGVRQVRKLTREEMDERRRKGLCINCDEQFVRGHQCKRLFLVDLDEVDEMEQLQQDLDSPATMPEISFNAIPGLQTAEPC